MDERKEMMENFGDMVNATERMSAPWKETAWKLLKALVLTNLFWAVIVAMLVWFAYMTPIESSQEQELTEGTQQQSYSQGVTDGE